MDSCECLKAEVNQCVVETLLICCEWHRYRVRFPDRELTDVSAARTVHDMGERMEFFQIAELRETGIGLPPESLEDTVRVCSGMCDIVVLRSGGSLDWQRVSAMSTSPVVNAGDGSNHPTQALIDWSRART